MWPAERLVRLYPRAWRERYGDEFVALAGPEPLRPQQVIDVISGAIDAWLSADVRNATAARQPANEGGPMVKPMRMVCERTSLRYTRRDSLVGAAVIVIGTALFALLSVALRREGWAFTGEILSSLAFSAGLMLSMPFWLMKGQPWKAQAAIIGGTLGLLSVIAVIAELT